MDFTYDSYIELIDLLKNKGYEFTNYIDYENVEKPVIFRHDIDNSLEKALELAKIEYNNQINSTYFVLLSTDFYNIFSKSSFEILSQIINLGHDIGLHFDEKRYDISNLEDLEYYVDYESEILGKALDIDIKAVSMHRPSKWILEKDMKFKNTINSYSKTFLEEFKYLSDSRMHWREDVLGIIEASEYDKLHILTHAFWYSKINGTINDKIMNYIDKAKDERYYQFRDNISDIDKIIKKGGKSYGNKIK